MNCHEVGCQSLEHRVFVLQEIRKKHYFQCGTYLVLGIGLHLLNRRPIKLFLNSPADKNMEYFPMFSTVILSEVYMFGLSIYSAFKAKKVTQQINKEYNKEIIPKSKNK